MPAAAPYQRMAKESSGVGRRASNKRTWMPMAARTRAASSAYSRLWLRQSWQTTAPAEAASPPWARIRLPRARVACRTTRAFMRRMPAPMTPRSPAVPKLRGAKNRSRISLSSPRMASSSRRSSAVSPSQPSQRSYSAR